MNFCQNEGQYMHTLTQIHNHRTNTVRQKQEKSRHNTYTECVGQTESVWFAHTSMQSKFHILQWTHAKHTPLAYIHRHTHIRARTSTHYHNQTSAMHTHAHHISSPYIEISVSKRPKNELSTCLVCFKHKRSIFNLVVVIDFRCAIFPSCPKKKREKTKLEEKYKMENNWENHTERTEQKHSNKINAI